jgi:hypothetical protein
VTSRPAPRLLLVVGWLLTPFVVWAASFSGGWLGATLGRRVPVLLGGVEWMLLGAVLGGATALALWVRRLRRARHPQQPPST